MKELLFILSLTVMRAGGNKGHSPHKGGARPGLSERGDPEAIEIRSAGRIVAFQTGFDAWRGEARRGMESSVEVHEVESAPTALERSEGRSSTKGELWRD